MNGTQYSVTFNRDISDCAYLATQDSRTTPAGVVGVTLQDPMTVAVQIEDFYPATIGSFFHLGVFCP
jgi:hypothetical protein